MSEGNNINEVKSLLPKVFDIYHKYVQLLKENKVPIDELVFNKRLSKDSNKYQNRNTVENNALTKLNSQGKYLKAREIVEYIITDYYQKTGSKNNRVIPIDLVIERTCYDVKRYGITYRSMQDPFGLEMTLPLIPVSLLQFDSVIGEGCEGLIGY